MTQLDGSTTLVLKDVFNRLSPEDIQRLSQVATMKRYPANIVLCHEGAIE